MDRYDIAVIGTGPAGLSAAVTAALRGKSVLLLGSRDLSEKLAKAPEIRNYLGLPDVSVAQLAAAFRRHLEQAGLVVTEKKISAVYAMGAFFALQAGEDMMEATAVILATGVVPGKELPGEKELLGRGVSYCATCDAPLYRGKTAAVIGYSPREEEEAAYLAGVCAQVLYFPVYPQQPDLPETVRIIREQVTAIEQADGRRLVRTEAGAYPADGVFVLRPAVAPDRLVPGLEADGPHIPVNRAMETNVPGVFACGDVTGTPYQYIKAAGEGNVAALSAVRYVDRLKKEMPDVPAL